MVIRVIRVIRVIGVITVIRANRVITSVLASLWRNSSILI